VAPTPPQATGPSPPPPPPAAWRAPRAALEAASRAARRQPAKVGIAVASLDSGQPQVAGTLKSGRAWSAIKVPLLVTVLRRERKRKGTRTGRRALSPAQRAAATAMLVESANPPSNAFFDELVEQTGSTEGAARLIESTLRAAGDTHTRIRPQEPDFVRTFTWLGQTWWRLADGVRFYRALGAGRLLPAADTRWVLGLLERAVGQDWGLGPAFAGAPLALKVGVGADPDGSLTTEQFAIAGFRGHACAIGVMAHGSSEAEAKAAAGTVADTLERAWPASQRHRGQPACE
jgi:hypothetical protein